MYANRFCAITAALVLITMAQAQSAPPPAGVIRIPAVARAFGFHIRILAQDLDLPLPASGAKPAQGAAPAAASAQPTLDASSPAVAGARPDPVGRALDSPAGAITDGWRFILYLFPVLLLIWLAVRGLKVLLNRTQGVPVQSRGLWAWLKSLGSRDASSGAIHVLESAPLGNGGLHLVEVRGRTLLIGTSGASVTLLTEFKEADAAAARSFESMLGVATVDDDDPSEAVAETVGSIDETLRRARRAIDESAARLRAEEDRTR